jgi:hypothetical protein
MSARISTDQLTHISKPWLLDGVGNDETVACAYSEKSRDQSAGEYERVSYAWSDFI